MPAGSLHPTTFQLTTSRGGRLLIIWYTSMLSVYFNSRPHEEVDHNNFCIDHYLNAFQLTTSRGGRRPALIRAALFALLFQLTTSRGGRPCPLSTLQYWYYFNSRPHEEVDVPDVLVSRIQVYFNSRPHEEVDERWRKYY